jgi:dTDP-L-rhamnose 4-epimerase
LPDKNNHPMKILITGGSGFIGSYLTDKLYSQGHEIYVIDNLLEQVHGKDKNNSYLFKSIIEKVNFYEEDITCSTSLKYLIGQVDYIVHLCAETGTGESMYNIYNYVKTNSLGTANILEQLVKNRNNVRKFILASSRAVYGEGKYRCNEHGTVYPDGRNIEDLHKGKYELKCPICSKDLIPLATDEGSKICPKSIYGISKFNQEQITKTVCESAKIPYTIFRFQNVYGKGQSIKNPYVGILSIFATLCNENKKILVFEDGLESRDFIHVSDAVQAIYLDILSEQSNQIYNVGTGISVKILDIVKMLESKFSSSSIHEISGFSRMGDIRHNVADITKISTNLGFNPKICLDEGLTELIDWIRNSHEDSIVKKYESSINELKKMNLIIGLKNEL